jgi:hypothetical protein
MRLNIVGYWVRKTYEMWTVMRKEVARGDAVLVQEALTSFK